MKKIFLLLTMLIAFGAMAQTKNIYIQGADIKQIDPIQNEVIVHSALLDGNLYVKTQAGLDVNLSGALSGMSISTAEVSNPAAAAEQTLGSFTIPASKLISNGDSVKLLAGGTFAGSDTNKRIRAYLGSQVLIDSASMSFTGNNSWLLEAECVRAASSAEKCTASLITSVTSFPATASTVIAAIDLTQAQIVKVTGASTTAASVIEEWFETILKP